MIFLSKLSSLTILLEIDGNLDLRANFNLNSFSADIEEFSSYVENRPFNDQIYSIKGNKIRELGWKEEVDFFPTFNTLIDDKSFIR